MPSDWLRIRQARLDLTDYVIHYTRHKEIDGKWLKPLDVLKLIVQDGFLKPSFAPRSSMTTGTRNDTIKGQYPAVCFTEQPLAAFLQSCKTLSGRYHRYAIAMRKGCLYKYGGRPVIYGDQDLLNQLSEDYKHLWVRFNPIPNADFGGYPIDWTHEREWRARVKEYCYPDLGSTPSEGVPLLMPLDSQSTEPTLCLP
jgi:hypothetical protein